MPDISTPSNAELIQLAQDVKSSVRKKEDPAGATTRLALFLGAGASISSGIIGAAEMTRHFKDVVYKRYGVSFGSDEKAENTWLKTQEWYKKDKTSDYSRFFEKCYDTERKRRSYIESIIEKAEPSFGYMVLANLISEGYFKTVITTNFDDLVYTSCTTYTSVRPVVYSLGGFATEMTLTDERPRILKLHGDFLYSSLKNTGPELQRQDENMAKEVKQVFSEYDGVVVVGYSGCDDSVMNLLQELPEGKTLYWCYRRGTKVPASVKKLVERTGRHLVEIEGFDEVMNFIRQFAEFPNNRLAGSFKHNIRRLTEMLFRFDDDSTVNFVNEISRSLRVLSLQMAQGNKAVSEGDTKRLLKICRRILRLDPTDEIAWYNLGSLLAEDISRATEAEEAYRKAIKIKPEYSDAWNNLGNLLSDDPARKKEAEDAYREAIEVKPRNAKAWSNLSFLLAENPARVAEALSLLKEYLKTYGHNLIILLRLTSLLLQNDQPEAEEYFEKLKEFARSDDSLSANPRYQQILKLKHDKNAGKGVKPNEPKKLAPRLKKKSRLKKQSDSE